MQELDEAARRRMPKQLYIPLPCDEARGSMLRRQLGPGCGVRADLPDADLAKIVARTAGYSGSDMRNLIQEASQVTLPSLECGVLWAVISFTKLPLWVPEAFRPTSCRGYTQEYSMLCKVGPEVAACRVQSEML